MRDEACRPAYAKTHLCQMGIPALRVRIMAWFMEWLSHPAQPEEKILALEATGPPWSGARVGVGMLRDAGDTLT